MERRIEKVESAHPNLKVIFGVLFLGFILAGTVTILSIIYMPKMQLFLGEIVIILPALFYVMLKKYDFRNVFRFNGIGHRLVGVSILLGVSTIIISDEIDRVVGSFVKVSPEFEELLKKLLTANTLSEWLVLFLSAVIVAGIIEEMLFRGMLQKGLENRFEGLSAIFLSAFVFAMFHPSPWLIQILVLGLILGYLAWRSNSIVPSLILHSFNNAFALLMINSDPAKLNWYNWNGHVNPPILTVAACITFYGFKWFNRFTQSENQEIFE